MNPLFKISVSNQMEKVCEFCMAFRPVVYCKADAAHLCLFCDVKVHSANTLSNKHPRALLCEVCKYRSAYVRCNDHNMFICRGCDRSLHKDINYQHQKRFIKGYIGCPSPKDFKLLWGLEMNQGHTEVYDKESLKQNSCIILQQILELERLQLSEGVKGSSFIRGKQQSDISSSIYDISRKLDKSLDHHLSVEADSNRGMSIDPFSSSFPSFEDLTSSSTAGEPFWQCRRSGRDFEMWSENTQDLGSCEEVAFYDSCNLPDVDRTFRNFEELFECDQDKDTALLDENNTIAFHKQDRSYTNAIEDASIALSVFDTQSAKLDKDISPFDHLIRTSYSAMSDSFSKLSADSSSAYYTDTRAQMLEQEPQCNPFEAKSAAALVGKGKRSMRYKDKMNARKHDNQSLGSTPKVEADAKSVQGLNL